ncbi:MAG: hypothetical protein IE922_08840 [Sphingomonadales bacterium]|nr:hypothetical protein [Sphingomonadales bacterium]
MVRRDPEALAGLGETADVHLVWQGRIRHPRVLNTAVAYVFPFWYLDPEGVYGASSLVGAPFDPGAVDAAAARTFFARQCNRLVARRESRIAQKREPTALPRGAIAVFLQGWSEPTERLRHMTEAEMLGAVLADTGGRPVIVKPHPNTADPETFELIAGLEGLPGVIVTDANVHDMLAVADLSVSLCSSVALEGMLHRVPAVLFGRSDLHHCAQTVTRARDWPAARNWALSRDWPFEAFVHWFLAQNTINAGAPDLWARTLARIAETTGIEADALGLGALADGAR